MQELLVLTVQWLDGATLGLCWLGITILALSMATCCVLLVRFPNVADRAITFDLIMVHLVSLIALSAIVLRYPLLMDTLVVVAVLGFLSTATIARYLERGLPVQKGVTPELPTVGVEPR